MREKVLCICPGRTAISPCTSLNRPYLRTSISKDHLQRELNQSRPSIAERISIRHIGRAGDRAEGGTVDRHVRQRKIGMVENVEELRAELQVHAVAHRYGLQHRKIRQVGSWTYHRIAPGV